MPGVVCRSMGSTERSLAWELVCTRALSLAHCSSSWCWRCVDVSFALAFFGSFFTLKTWWSSRTPRTVSASSRHGWLVWKVNGPMSIWRRRHPWSVGLVMLSSKKSGKYPCAVSSSDVGNNFIQYSQCMMWVHKKCIGITKPLVDITYYICCRCEGEATNGWTVTHVDVDGTMIDVEATFCYLSDMLCSGEAVQVLNLISFHDSIFWARILLQLKIFGNASLIQTSLG